MECLTCREALSARLDGEDEPVPAERTDEHLAGCPACRDWQARAVAGARLLRVRPAARVPDLTDRVLAEAAVPPRTRDLLPRGLLGVVAVAQLGLALSQVFGSSGHGAHPEATHLFNESTAWNLALGIGFYWTAWRPRTAGSALPILTGFVLVLLAYSAHDLLTGAAPVGRVLGHGLVVAGLVLMFVLHRSQRGPTPGTTATEDDERPIGADLTGDPEAAAGTTARTGRHLRPAGRHRAA
ncbi:zf-HC2 domain-containing protein [Actinokineospora bangkokensis]|uniref:Putative zinc-finger domain-containing protein n=1 Tax=Actinokineospora bangkokensis TaxID=1193682 RepID=A0A1Q9LIZ7_9PSEU|nr:zf-HC2 domain-containing protein [Actinokineospora bangkokensis]OLR91983.1 hypothetical protein BJP25_24525 [Actinokineospora bangkokensis]